ncbi:MAG: ribonuclease H-like domain-containing protein [Chloroflexi bacterium]|nr:ribonuclease H-like domain-containing protein [Chloroflexota bacterium]
MSDPSLSDKLKSLGVRVGAGHLPRPPQKPGTSIDQVVPGRVLQTALGETFQVVNYYPADYQHGHVPLNGTASLHMIYEWGRTAQLVNADLHRFAFLDTETTGLAGGTGTYAFMVGVGRFVPEGFEVTQFFMRDPTEEPGLLAALTAWMGSCQALVTFNGKAFDVPLLNARYTLQGMASPVAGLPHLDLLPLARRLWRDRLPSRALSYLETSILGAYRSQEEVPGWLIPQIYFDYLRSGDARPLQGVFYHNGMDILALAALFSHTAQMLEAPLDAQIEEASDLAAIARLFEELGYTTLAAQIYHAVLERGLTEQPFWETVERLSFLYRRRREWLAAVDLWQKAAEYGQMYAHVELAKYYEHEVREYGEALRWTRQAIDRVQSAGFPPYQRRQWLAELEHRLERLRRKVS